MAWRDCPPSTALPRPPALVRFLQLRKPWSLRIFVQVLLQRDKSQAPVPTIFGFKSSSIGWGENLYQNPFRDQGFRCVSWEDNLNPTCYRLGFAICLFGLGCSGKPSIARSAPSAVHLFWRRCSSKHSIARSVALMFICDDALENLEPQKCPPSCLHAFWRCLESQWLSVIPSLMMVFRRTLKREGCPACFALVSMLWPGLCKDLMDISQVLVPQSFG